VRAQLLFEPRDNVEIHVLGSYNSTHYRTTYTHVAAGFNSDGLEYALSPSEDFYGTCPGCDASGYGNHGDLQTVDINADQTFTDLEISSFTGIMNWDVHWARFTSVTAYSEAEAKHFEDSDASPLDGLNFSNPRKEDWLTQEFRLANEESGLRWQLGVFLIDWDARVNNGEASLNLPYVGVQGQGTWQVHHTAQDRETKSWAVFGQIEKDLGSIPGLTFLLGLRWTDNVLTNDFRGYVEVDGVRVPGSEVDFREETVGDDAKINDDFLTGKAGINYKVYDDLLLYVSYSLGKKSGLSVNGILAAPPEEINRETVDAYEVGMKGTFLKNRMQLNMAAFYYDYSDCQAFVFENLNGGLRNVQSTVSGAEAEMVVTPAEGWFASLSVGYLDGVLKDVGLPTGRVIDMESPMAPTWKWGALLRKEWSAFGGTLALQGDITYSDSFFSDAVNTPVSAFDTERTLLDARVDWVTGDGKWELAINARNLTDEDYYQLVAALGIGLAEAVPGLPRQLNAQIRHRF
jgi:iron complex outermembrane receptor protein